MAGAGVFAQGAAFGKAGAGVDREGCKDSQDGAGGAAGLLGLGSESADDRAVSARPVDLV